MRRILILGFFLIHAGSMLFAEEVKFPVSTIPEELLKDALAVVRTDETVLEIRDDLTATQTCHYAVTVLNDNGKDFGYFYGPYSKFLKYKNVRATLWDKNGNKDRKIKQEEIYDVSNIASYSLYEDSRVIIVEPQSGDYPYTVEYSYEIEYKGFFTFQPWYILSNFDISSEFASIKVSYPESLKIRFYEVGPLPEPVKSNEEGVNTVEYEARNVTAIKYEPYAPDLSTVFPNLQIEPSKMNYGGSEGDISTWDSFGEWVYSLIEDKTDFTPETETEIRELVKNCSSDEEKVKVLYGYMQDKVRYVNISIGIGGLEPIEAQRVHDVSYGDCKALTNYMRSMLKAVGIESVYTLVNAGSQPRRIFEEFPSQQFNHVILMVPMVNDSIWLECTSQRLPAGYLGSFTDDRPVLHVTEEGGKMGRSPKFSAEENQICTKVGIILDSNLDAGISRSRNYTGYFFGDQYSAFLGNDAIEQERKMQQSLDLSGFTLEEFKYTPTTSIPPAMLEEIIVKDDAFVTRSGEYVLLPLTRLSRTVSTPTRVRNRKQEIFVSRGRTYRDTVLIELPDNLAVFEIPGGVSLSSDFGSYTSKVEKTESGIKYTREIIFHPGTFPAERYRDFYDYYREMNKADGQEVMLKIK